MAEGDLDTPRPRDRVAASIIGLVQSNPDFSYSDIRRLVGERYPRKVATGELFDFILEKITTELVIPKLTKNQANLLHTKKVEYTKSEIAQGRIDDLTGLPRRKQFLELLAHEGRQHPGPWTLVMVDLDHFKNCNDVYGHDAGDQMLRGFSDLLQTTFNHGKGSIAGRWGGEEFVVAVPGRLMPEDERLKVLQTSYKQLAQASCSKPDVLFGGTISAGIAHFNQTQPITESITRADQALLQAKNTGRNKIEVWRPDG